MSPEKFHDALNYLDDDLIAETDALRRGLRTRPAARKVISWLVPAACLALVLGVAPRLMPAMEADNSAQMPFEGLLDTENGSPGESAMESIHGNTNQSTHEAPETWERVSNKAISLALPAGWEYELTIADDGSHGIAIRPAGAEGFIRVGYQPGFAVCGTGLEEKQTTIAGMAANVGYYDGGRIWSFITFPGSDYVILNDGAGGWFASHAETIEQILETIEFG